MTKRVLIEVDGGSRGNPGPAAYGAVLKDAETGAVIAEDGTRIGVATNNVAEYSGLIAGLRLAEAHAPGAEIEVRLDSKLVVEQMSGRWKIKHPEMRSLAAEATRLAPDGTTYTWVPRERNLHADRLVNEALDGKRDGVSVPGDEDSLIEEIESPAAAAEGDAPASIQSQARGWSAGSSTPTTLVLVRHGVTAHTVDKRFSGGLASSNPGLSDDGRAQVRATAEWLAPIAERVEAVIASPVRRTRESAEIVAEVLGRPLTEEPGFAEMEFGVWDGMTFGEVAKAHPEGLDAWLGSLDVAPEGGESFRVVEERVLEGLQRVLDAHAGRTVVVVSHVTPIKTLVAHAVNAPLDSVFRMELSPASVTVVSFFNGGADGLEPRTSMRLYNALPPARDAFSDPTAW
ncbi:bifunctional RNase H/acid phosphatase [Nocardioides szechwanensis]|uniref:Probable phosphoglycerate mutase n=1 Tax=Nocardioides szechwanensis TaxID=1005944 RepID=A0A1H0HEA7_9ACTN|nr:bifunctional RNase H/acid phosphatase [Nocardioides szechwanensis]GEP34269.1 bifunctional RNase H/acid phosphatase [Nocardioides szechwanensis]SDO17374.1 probable phosphoglycerate mutase [Nocardioides szechwanensis]